MTTYTDRDIETVKIVSVLDGYVRTEHWLVGASPAVRARLTPGATVDVETRNLSQVVGWRVDGEWIERKSDEQLEAERQALVATWRHDKEDRLANHRAEWAQREAALPDWIRTRLEHFRATGSDFDLEGWGYELVVAELAVLYAASGGEDSPDVLALADREGTSGNQHDIAKALARAHREGVNLAGTVAALSPITGKAGY